MLTAGGAIGGGHLQQAVGVDIEGNLHLGHTPGCRRDTRKAEPAQRLVVGGHLAFALEHVDFHRVLIRLRGAEQIALAHGDGRVAGDQHLHHTANRLQPKREGRDVIEHQIAKLTGEDAGLHGGANRHHLIGIDSLTGLERDQGAHQLLHHRHAGGAAHQNHLVDVLGRQGGISQRPLHRSQQAIQQIGAEGLEAAPLEAGLDMQGPGLSRGDEGQRDRRGLHATQFDLGLFGRLGKPLQGLAIAA